MPRDKDALTDKELFRKTADIIESACDCRIDITYWSEDNYVRRVAVDNEYSEKNVKNRYSINISTPAIKGLEKFTALVHELSHIMHESPVEGANKLVRSWSKELNLFDDGNEYNICSLSHTDIDNDNPENKPECPTCNYKGWENSTLEERQYEAKCRANSSYRRSIQRNLFNAFNILEDQRIESLTEDIWLASRHRFDKARKNLGKEMKPIKDENPIGGLLAQRFQRYDLVDSMFKSREDIASAINDVEKTGKYGALLVMIKIKPMIMNYVKGKRLEMAELDLGIMAKKMTESEKEEVIDNDGQVFNGNYRSEEDYEAAGYESERSNSLQEEEQMFNEMATTKKGDNHDQLQQGELTMEEDQELGELMKEFEGMEEELQEDDEKWEEVLQMEKDNGEEHLESLKSSIFGDGSSTQNIMPSHYKKVERNFSGDIEPNILAAKGMNKLFKKLIEMPKEFIDYVGDEVDIDSYIDNRVRGFDIGECLVDERNTQGASIVISIDGSGSMSRNNGIDQARNLVATLYESLRGIPNIEVRANVWSSDVNGNVGITEIKNKGELNKINTTADYWLTPTHEALRFSAMQIKEMRGKKKLLILITDGHPQFRQNVPKTI